MGVFERIVCGVDGSPESLEAVRQADVLLEPGGRLVLVAVVDLMDAIHFQVAPTPLHAARHALADAEKLEQAASEWLERPRAEVARAREVEAHVTGGSPAPALLETAATERATLLVVGTHGLGRAAGVLLGSVANRVLESAPCAVLVARPGNRPPRTIVAGADASPEADAALATGRELEARLGAELRVLTGADAHALAAASEGADLVVVGAGARRHGLRSLAEHVAHDARCSVLVVR